MEVLGNAMGGNHFTIHKCFKSTCFNLDLDDYISIKLEKMVNDVLFTTEKTLLN